MDSVLIITGMTLRYFTIFAKFKIKVVVKTFNQMIDSIRGNITLEKNSSLCWTARFMRVPKIK